MHFGLLWLGVSAESPEDGLPSLESYFLNDFKQVNIGATFKVVKSDGRTYEAKVRDHLDFDAGARFASCFLPPGIANPDALVAVVRSLPALFARNDEQVNIQTGSIADPFGPRFSMEDLVQTGKVYIYIDEELPIFDRASLLTYLGTKFGPGRVEIRDHAYRREMNSKRRPVAFVSHDSGDKESIARPLAVKLSALRCPVWFDEFSVTVGQSLREQIDQGIASCGHCIVLLSPNYLANAKWAKAEFNAAMTKHINAGGGTVLPVWAGVDYQTVSGFSHIVADLAALNFDSLGVDGVARRLASVLRANGA